MPTQPAPASAGDETEEDQQFNDIFQHIARDVSIARHISGGSKYSAGLGTNWLKKKKKETLVIITYTIIYVYTAWGKRLLFHRGLPQSKKIIKELLKISATGLRIVKCIIKVCKNKVHLLERNVI